MTLPPPGKQPAAGREAIGSRLRLGDLFAPIAGRTTRPPGYQVGQRKRKLVEQVFGWLRTVGGLRKLRNRDEALVDWTVTFPAATCNLVRLRTLVATCP